MTWRRNTTSLFNLRDFPRKSVKKLPLKRYMRLKIHLKFHLVVSHRASNFSLNWSTERVKKWRSSFGLILFCHLKNCHRCLTFFHCLISFKSKVRLKTIFQLLMCNNFRKEFLLQNRTLLANYNILFLCLNHWSKLPYQADCHRVGSYWALGQLAKASLFEIKSYLEESWFHLALTIWKKYGNKSSKSFKCKMIGPIIGIAGKPGVKK